jgi:hypothetical protein
MKILGSDGWVDADLVVPRRDTEDGSRDERNGEEQETTDPHGGISYELTGLPGIIGVGRRRES